MSELSDEMLPKALRGLPKDHPTIVALQAAVANGDSAAIEKVLREAGVDVTPLRHMDTERMDDM